MNYPRHVMHVIESLGRGGAEQALLTILPLLRRQGVQSEVVVLDGSKPEKRALLSDFEQAGIPVKCLAAGGLQARARQLNALLQGGAVDALHAHLTRSVLVSGCATRALSAPPVLLGHLHNLGYEKPVAWRNRPKHWLKKRMAIRAAASFDRWLAVSQAVKYHYQQHWRLAGECVTVIPNPVQLANDSLTGTPARVPSGTALKEGADEPLIVLPGRLVAEKNHQFALRLARKFADTGKKLQWVFAGGGPLHDRIQSQIGRLGLEGTVAITGHLPQAELHDWLARATVVIQPSAQEGFGMTAAEAMALGKAVLVSDAGGLPELAGDAARVLPIDNGTAWYAGLNYLLDSPVARAALGQAARQRIESTFLPERIAALWLQFYRQIGKSQAAGKRSHSLHKPLGSKG